MRAALSKVDIDAICVRRQILLDRLELRKYRDNHKLHVYQETENNLIVSSRFAVVFGFLCCGRSQDAGRARGAWSSW